MTIDFNKLPGIKFHNPFSDFYIIIQHGSSIIFCDFSKRIFLWATPFFASESNNIYEISLLKRRERKLINYINFCYIYCNWLNWPSLSYCWQTPPHDKNIQNVARNAKKLNETRWARPNKTKLMGDNLRRALVTSSNPQMRPTFGPLCQLDTLKLLSRFQPLSPNKIEINPKFSYFFQILIKSIQILT